MARFPIVYRDNTSSDRGICVVASSRCGGLAGVRWVVAIDLGSLLRRLYSKLTSMKAKTPKILRANTSLASYAYYIKSRVLQRGFPSYTAYLNAFAEANGYSSIKEYNAAKLKERGIKSPSHHHKILAQARGLNSSTEYQRSLALQRKMRVRYQRLARLLTVRLRRMGKSQQWLAQETGISRQLVSRYCNGLSFPKRDKLVQIGNALFIDLIPIDHEEQSSP